MCTNRRGFSGFVTTPTRIYYETDFRRFLVISETLLSRGGVLLCCTIRAFSVRFHGRFLSSTGVVSSQYVFLLRRHVSAKDEGHTFITVRNTLCTGDHPRIRGEKRKKRDFLKKKNYPSSARKSSLVAFTRSRPLGRGLAATRRLEMGRV